MALRVWLPLNGTLDNIGISDVTVTNNGATVDNNGKIGKCYYFNASTYIYENSYDWTNFNTSEFSLCCWYKEPSPVASGNSQIICIGTSSGWNNIRIGLLRRTSNGYPMFSVSDGTSAVQYSFTATSFTFDTWNHIAVTYNNGQMSMYINGILNKTSTTAITPVLNSSQHLGIGAASNGAEKLTGYLNDVRIYDHCLSPKEVKEISQGLVLHYKLDGWSGGAGENLLCGSASVGNTSASIPGWISNGSASNIEILNNNIIHYKYNLNNTKYIPSIVSNVVAPLQWGKTYVYSMDLKLDKDITLGSSVPMHYWLGARNADDIWQTAINTHNISGSTTTTWVQNHNGILSANTWVTIITKFTLPTNAVESGYNYPGLRPFIYGSVLTSEYTGEVNVWMKNCKIELGSITTPWTLAPEDLGIDTTKITDSSGYGNDGTIVGTLTTQQDSPRYGISTSFAASSAINCGRGAMVTDSITVNLWVKYSSYSNLVSCTEGGGWNFENNSGLTFPVYIASVGYVHIDAANRPPVANYANSWHMFTGVYDRLNKLTKLYIDGELIGTGAVSSPNLIQYNGSNVIWLNAEATGSNETGSYGNAKSFSDFRIYATALSAEDILDLYHTPANIDNLGGLHGFEMVEKNGNMLAGSPIVAGSGATVTWDETNGYYIITSPTSTSNWGIGPAVGTTPKKIIPWGYSYRLTYEVYTPTAATWYIDYNNNDVDVTLSGNDNDTGRIASSIAVPANQWTVITLGCSNTNETKNPNHLPLYDYSTGLGPVMTNISSPITWYMRNPQWYLVDTDNITNHQIYKNGVVQDNFFKEDLQNTFASTRNNEKAMWATGFIEK